MIYPNPFNAQGRSRRRRFSWGALAFAIVLLLFFGALLVWRTAAAGAFWRLMTPAFLFRDRISGSDSVSLLQAELASTTAELADRDALYQETLELKKLLGRPESETEVLAAVLLRPPGVPYDTLVVDAGQMQGIAVGELVFAGGTTAIGDVTEVYGTTARVTLFSAPGRTYDAEVTASSSLGTMLPLALNGQGAGSLMGQVPAGSGISAGDIITIPGIGNDYLGHVSHVDAPAGSSFETIYVSLPVDLFSLKYVEIQTQL